MSYDHAAIARHTTAGAMPKAPKPQQLDPKARELLERSLTFIQSVARGHSDAVKWPLAKEINDYLKGKP